MKISLLGLKYTLRKYVNANASNYTSLLSEMCQLHSQKHISINYGQFSDMADQQFGKESYKTS